MRTQIATADRGVEYLRRIGDRVQEQAVLAGTISTRVLVGRWDDAYALLAEIYGPDLAAVGDLWEDLHVVEIACWRGRLDEAKEHIQRHSEAALPHADSQRRTSYHFPCRTDRADGGRRERFTRGDRA